ncbi:MAG TPA: acyl-CoA dehydrogenase [Syntrophomonas sp.]|nr:acyl-CoA dehydrogenase [Syntrophomonas sp.]
MDFRLTDEQELLLESIREFVAEHFNEEKIQQWYKDGSVPDEVLIAFKDVGFAFLGIPEEYGGVPIDKLTFCLVMEELTRAAGCSTPFELNLLSMYDICEFGSPEQIALCMDLYSKEGKPPFALAISEPGAGSDNMAMATTVKEIDGKLVLSGQKTWVSGGLKVPYMLVVAKDDDPSPQNTGMSMWLVPMNLPGIKTAPIHKIGQKLLPLCDIWFDNVVVEESMRVGERGQGFINLMKNFEVERLSLAAWSVGLAQCALEDAAAYAAQRVTFGKPIGNYQLIQQKLTDMEIKVQNMRCMVYRVAWELDNGMPVQLNSALAKRYVSMTATDVCNEAMQIMGGIGYTEDCRISRLWEDARGQQFAGGTDEIMVHISGKQIIKKYSR